jgi:phage baseplate assembly protein W
MAKVLSTEDDNLSTSILLSTEDVYKDIDLTLALNSSTGDIYRKKDASAVKQSIKTLLLTNRFEKPFRPQFGANLQSLLFGLADGLTGKDITERIKESIEAFEPRARLQKLKVTSVPDRNSIRVRVEFKVVNSTRIEVIETQISRLR